ncbi:hypothetical protein B0H66DRAFT_99091 [Apodospora peruviana]|uniref:Uncharacterized protein n=1 Tax=Apodospora peruviana TaxID=516989 RepID=A0AAE0IV66_9PEZI|nr:hypothetical protein B0H66DRAFT_99091 [Apodospora peruviana]
MTSTMTDQPRSKIMEENPVGRGLDAFHTSFNLPCAKRKISGTTDALGQLDQEDVQYLTLDLLSTLLNIPATLLLPSKTGRGTLRNDLLKLISAVRVALCNKQSLTARTRCCKVNT